jgi:glycosyltransferase involved in cell wall biosynthesis
MTPVIAINGRFLTQRMVGVHRFAIEVVKAIDGLLDDGDYPALKGRIEIVAPAAARDFPLRHITLRRCGRVGGYTWEQIEFPFFARGRFLLNLCMLGPLAMRRQVVVVHDAMVRAQPANFTARFRAAYNFLIPRLCRRSFAAVTVSEFSRQEIGKWFGVDVGAMPVCSEGADHITALTADQSIIDRLGLSGRRFFLAVGAGNNKNIETVVAAWREAGLADTLVVRTGYRQSRVNKAFDRNLVEEVCEAGYVSDAELRALYEHALALVSPSRYEGFGLPPVEAMTCGCPVIISDQPALVAVAGDAALQCGADDVDTLAGLMRRIHDDAALRKKMIDAGRARAAHFTWRKTARRLLDVCVAGLG